MKHAEGHSYGESQMQGTTKSTAKNAPMDQESGGNYGKAIGDKGRTNPLGNRKTKCDADRYPGSKSNSGSAKGDY